jgi:hypothetical protein
LVLKTATKKLAWPETAFKFLVANWWQIEGKTLAQKTNFWKDQKFTKAALIAA